MAISSDILNQETDARFWAQTGYKPGQKLNPSIPTDKAMEPVWRDIYKKVKAEADAGKLVTTFDHPAVAQHLSDAAVAHQAAGAHAAAASMAPDAVSAHANVVAATTAQQISTQKAREAASRQPPTVSPALVKDAAREVSKNPPPPQVPVSEHIAHEHVHRHAPDHAQAVHVQAQAQQASLAALFQETDKRFWAQTNYKPGKKLDMSIPQDVEMSKIWWQIFHQVQAEAAAAAGAPAPDLAASAPPSPDAPPPDAPPPADAAPPPNVAPPAAPPFVPPSMFAAPPPHPHRVPRVPHAPLPPHLMAPPRQALPPHLMPPHLVPPHLRPPPQAAHAAWPWPWPMPHPAMRPSMGPPARSLPPHLGPPHVVAPPLGVHGRRAPHHRGVYGGVRFDPRVVIPGMPGRGPGSDGSAPPPGGLTDVVGPATPPSDVSAPPSGSPDGGPGPAAGGGTPSDCAPSSDSSGMSAGTIALIVLGVAVGGAILYTGVKHASGSKSTGSRSRAPKGLPAPRPLRLPERSASASEDGPASPIAALPRPARALPSRARI